MKTIIVTVVLALCAMTANAQKTNPPAVPEPVKQSMKKLYPSARDIEWELEKNDYEASFKNGGQEQSVLFDASGSVLETEVEIPLAALPKAAQQYLAEHHKDQKIKETAKITDAKGTVTYEAEIKGKDLLFDNNGKFLKEHQEEEDHEDND